jgi:hypothetical protein
MVPENRAKTAENTVEACPPRMTQFERDVAAGLPVTTGRIARVSASWLMDRIYSQTMRSSAFAIDLL